MKARTLWTWAIANIIILVVTVPFLRDSLDHSVSGGILAAVTLTVALMAVRTARAGEAGEIKSLRYLVWQKLRKNRAAMVGMGVVVALLYAAMLSPFITPQDPYVINWAAITTGPTELNVFGTDDLGRDVLSRAIFGLRIVIGVSVLAVIVNMVLGTVFGLLAGYYGGMTDALIMRILEMWNSIPFILLAIALMAALGSSLINLVLVVSLSGIMQLARLIRGQVLVIRKSQFVDAAKVMGVPGTGYSASAYPAAYDRADRCDVHPENR